MSRKALTDQKHEAIMAHIADPDNSPLPADQKEQLDRVISMSKLLDKYPTIKQAVAIHKSKYGEISHATAYRDVALARKVYNSMHEFDYDFYRSWLINDIIANIQRCSNKGKGKDSHQYSRVIAMEHANLLKVIGEKPEELEDPMRNEKHNFYIMVNVNNQNIKLDLEHLSKLDPNTLQELNKAIMGGNEIDDQGAAEIMNS